MNKTKMINKKFGRLAVIEEAGIDKSRHALWKCECDCGKIRIIEGNKLRSGHTKSCGCLKKELVLEAVTTHGMCKTPTYKTWQSMKWRCSNPNCPDYHYYGGKGITVCKRWLNFENFFTDMGERPEGLTIERVDSNHGYYKANCKWATYTEQSRNQNISIKNKTGARGVCWNKFHQKYQVAIGVKNKSRHIGYFIDIEQAKIARKIAEQKYWRE